MKLKLFYFLWFITISLTAQTKLRVDFDYARFNYDDSSSYLEIYYSFYQPELVINTNELDVESVKGQLSVTIIDQNTDSVFVDKDYQFSSSLNIADTSDKSLIGFIGFLLPFGSYSVSLVGMDGNQLTSMDSVNFIVEINEFPDDIYSVSDIELSGSIKESENTNSLFYKNTYEVIPNPGSIYGEPLPVIYFYSEIYNVDQSVSSENLKVEHILLNSQNKVFYRKAKLIPRKNPSVVEVGAINVSKAPSGVYMLVVAVSDTVLEKTMYSSKRIFVYNPSIVDTSVNILADQNVMSSEFASMSEEELEEIYNFSRYIATSAEISQWQKIKELEGKRVFLFNFWKARDNNINTPVNEEKRDYFQRVERANQQYSTMQKKGWRTDRGRVLLTYGHPSEIERYPNQVDSKPYEIWQYDQIDGGVIFIFADMTGFSDYQLIHSTHRNELRDENWARKVNTY
jgi:GWxTD domain-containing protein